MTVEAGSEFGLELAPGSRHHRAFVGPPGTYDIMAAAQFNLLTFLGLREGQSLLDIGCGSLRAGRLFIAYLRPGGYCGLEPNEWLLQEGIEKELGREALAIKQPTFLSEDGFTLSAFRRSFDFLLAQSIFSHASAGQIRRCFSEARRVMGRDSIFVATWLRGERDYDGEAWVYPACVTYRADTMAAFASGAGLRFTPLAWPHAHGQSWMALTDPSFDVRPFEEMSDAVRMDVLRSDLARCQERLARLERHPWTVLGKRIRGLVRAIFRR